MKVQTVNIPTTGDRVIDIHTQKAGEVRYAEIVVYVQFDDDPPGTKTMVSPSYLTCPHGCSLGKPCPDCDAEQGATP